MAIELSYEVADGITLASMQQHLKFLKKELKEFRKGNTYMHPDDAYKSEFVLIPAFETLITYYGG